MRRQASGAPRAPTADLESPLGLVVGGRCPCSLPRCGWLHCRPISGSAAFPIKAWCGQPKADHFGPINRKGEAVSSKARPGLLFGFLLVWGRHHKPRPRPPVSANCMYNGEYSCRWRWSSLSGRVSHPTSPMTASSLSLRQPVPTSPVLDSSKKPSQEAKDERLNFRANERLVSILAQLKDGYGITMSESIRRGVALFSIAKRESAKGRSLAFIDQEGKVVSEVHTI